MPESPLRNLPSVDQLLQNPMLQQLVQQASRNSVVQKVRETLDDVRRRVGETAEDAHIPSAQEIVDTVAGWMYRESALELRPVVNATGVLLHTGLGRAPLPKPAIQGIAELSERYSSLELDLESGQRGKRTSAVERLLCELTGAEAATVVNNNAAATMLTLAAICSGRQVIVSRGQLVEIGGSYRLPDVMATSGARLVEVGTTNKTRIDDYQSAIDETTGAIMRVHPSNYVVCGFTESPDLKSLSELARKKQVPLIDDIGSGALMDFEQFGLRQEPLVSASVGLADLVLFSGDKLLGGPQCGLIVGRKSLVTRITKHPMMRAFRVGKLTLAALQATLKLYRDPAVASELIPLLRMIQTPRENLKLRASKLVEQLNGNPIVRDVTICDSKATLGGGSLPTQSLDSLAVKVVPSELSVQELTDRLRQGHPPVVGRIQEDSLWLDLKSVNPAEDRQIVEAFSALAPIVTKPESQDS